MKDDLTKLKQIAESQEKQIITLRKAIDVLVRRLQDTDKRAHRNSESIRKTVNDINTIKRKLGS